MFSDYSCNKKLLLIESRNDCNNYCEDQCDCVPDVTFKEITSFSDIMEHVSFVDRGAIAKALIATPFLREALSAEGWRNVKDMKDQSDKVIMEDGFYFADGFRGSPPHNHYGSLSETMLEDINESYASKLSDGSAFLLRKVSLTSLKSLNPALYKKCQEAGKKKKEAKARAAKAAATRKKNKKMKEIAKAKKLLEEAGEL